MLRRESVDVLVTDLNMPVMDGYKLIASVHALFPSIPVIVLTSLPSGAPQDKALALGALRVLSKPVRLSLLMEEIKQLGSQETDGFVRGVSLSGLLQLMGWEGKTCTLTVKRRAPPSATSTSRAAGSSMRSAERGRDWRRPTGSWPGPSPGWSSWMPAGSRARSRWPPRRS